MGKVVSHIEVDDGDVTVEVEREGTVVAKMTVFSEGGTFFDEAMCCADDPCDDMVFCTHDEWEWVGVSASRFAWWVSVSG